jgi:predicted nucleotidyltransferase
MGVPPVRLEVITNASGVVFKECYSNREVVVIDGIPINFIALQDLKKNKRAAGRHKDLEDIEHLP